MYGLTVHAVMRITESVRICRKNKFPFHFCLFASQHFILIEGEEIICWRLNQKVVCTPVAVFLSLGFERSVYPDR